MASSKRDFALASLRQARNQVASVASAAEFGAMALTMVFVRATRPSDWENWPGRGNQITDYLQGELTAELGPGINPAVSMLRTLPVPTTLTRLIEIIDQAAGRAGDDGVFQATLEEFAWDRDVITPSSVAAVMTNAVGIDEKTSVYDPFCRAGELLVAAAAHAPRDFIWGDTPDLKSMAIARMNARMHGIEGSVGNCKIDDPPLRGTLGAARILTNPPFNADHSFPDYDPRWRYGPPPRGNANFAWLQHVIDRLEPAGRAAVVMPNRAASSASPRERRIREGLVTDGCVEALISLPASLFRGTAVPVTIWLVEPPGTRRDKILFVDASSAGRMVSRTLRELSDSEIDTITRIVTEWRNAAPRTEPNAISAAQAALEEIRERDYNLNPSLYMPSALTTTAPPPQLRQRLGQLETEHSIAQEKDAEATRVLRNLLG